MNNTNVEKLMVSAPGRICLFGEHQDYLGLSVITAAINLRIFINGQKRNDRVFNVDLPDIETKEKINLNQPIKYLNDRDYLRSGLNVLLRQHVNLPHGYNCIIGGDIPINAGTSSSSALIVAWIKFLLTIAADERATNPYEIARFAHQAEVVEFNEPGGMMDHYAASLGSLLYIDFSKCNHPQHIPVKLGRFVLGDSLEPKDTKGILARVKNDTLKAIDILSKRNRTLNIKSITLDELEFYKNLLSQEQFELIKANIINREITFQARDILFQENVDHHQLGCLLNNHQRELRDRLHISTPKINRMIDAAINAGAFGAKINGSGGGGCMLAYAPDFYEQIAEAIIRAGGKPYIISIDEGVM